MCWTPLSVSEDAAVEFHFKSQGHFINGYPYSSEEDFAKAHPYVHLEIIDPNLISRVT